MNKRDELELRIWTMEKFERLYLILEKLISLVGELEERVQKLEAKEEKV